MDKVLIVGGGGGEHALAWKLRQALERRDVFVAPGNGGTRQIALNVPVAADDAGGLVALVKRWDIGLIIVGAGEQLGPGVADRFRRERMTFIGASQGAELIRSDLTSVARVMTKAGVHALETPRASSSGQKLTAYAFTDGISVSSVVATYEFSHLEGNSSGPDTGSAGGYSPPHSWTPALADQVRNTILGPIVRTFEQEGSPHSGIIGARLVLTDSGPRIVELIDGFNDPAAQMVIPRLQTDLLEIAKAILAGKLEELDIEWSPDSTVAVSLTAEGYPGHYKDGETFLLTGNPRGLVFHGDTIAGGYYIYTSGCQVATAVGSGTLLETARQQAYETAASVEFKGVQYRRDIAASSSH
jgi:phosphoribosylamine--glycine ligase